MDIKLPIINQGLKLLNESPIAARQLKSEKWVDDKVKKLASNLQKQLVGSCDLIFGSKQAVLDLQSMLNTFKQKFHEEETTKTQKIQLLTLLPMDWSLKKVSDIMGASDYMIRQAKELVRTEGILSTPASKLGLYSLFNPLPFSL